MSAMLHDKPHTFNTTLVIKITVVITLTTMVTNITTDFLVTSYWSYICTISGFHYSIRSSLFWDLTQCWLVLTYYLLLTTSQHSADLRVTHVPVLCKHIKSVLLCSISYCFNFSTTTICFHHCNQSSQAVFVTLEWKFCLSSAWQLSFGSHGAAYIKTNRSVEQHHRCTQVKATSTTV